MEIAEQLCAYARLAYERNLVGAAGGNLSARLDGSDRILITASGVSLRDVTPDSLIVTDLDAVKLSGPEHLRPSKESSLHTSVYRARPDVHAILHVHPMYCTGVSLDGGCIPICTVSSKLKLVEIPRVPEFSPGSPELAGAIERLAATGPRHVTSILLDSHGIICWGDTLEDAFNTAELTEETARVAFVHAMLTRGIPR